MTLAERILADRCEHVTGNQLLCANCRQSAAAIVEAAERVTKQQEAADEAEGRLAQTPYRSGSIGYEFIASQVSRAKYELRSAIAALAAAGRPHAETR